MGDTAEKLYGDADHPRIAAALASWISSTDAPGYCHVGELHHRIYEGLRLAPAGDHLVRFWCRGTEVVAIAITGRFGEAFDVLVAPALRGTVEELAFLRRAEAVTAQGVGTIDPPCVVTDAEAADRVRIDALEQLGYEPYRTWDHLAKRMLTNLPAAEVPGGYRLRPAGFADADELGRARAGASVTAGSRASSSES
jgi:mycothiol synthase